MSNNRDTNAAVSNPVTVDNYTTISNPITIIGEKQDIENYLEEETEKAIITKNHKLISSLNTLGSKKEFTKIQKYKREFLIYSSNPMLPKVKDNTIDVKDLVKVQYDKEKFMTFDKLKPSAIPLSATIVTLTDATIAKTLTSIFIPKRVTNCDFIYSVIDEESQTIDDSILRFENCKRLILQNDAPISSGFRFNKRYFEYKFPALEYFQYEGKCYKSGSNNIISPCYIENNVVYDNSKFGDHNSDQEPTNETCVFTNKCFYTNQTIKTVVILSSDFNAIPYSMFELSSIEKFVSNSPIRHINTGAFLLARQLYACEFPVEHLEYIGESAFNDVRVSSFDFTNANRLTMIKSYAFANNPSLIEFKFYREADINLVYKIGHSLFMNCVNLQKVIEPINSSSHEKQFNNVRILEDPSNNNYLVMHEKAFALSFNLLDSTYPITDLINYYNTQRYNSSDLKSIIDEDFWHHLFYFHNNRTYSPKVLQYFQCKSFNPMNTATSSTINGSYITANHFTYYENKGAYDSGSYYNTLCVYPLTNCIGTFACSNIRDVTIMLPTELELRAKLTLRYAFKDCYNLSRLTFFVDRMYANDTAAYAFSLSAFDFFMMFAFGIKQQIYLRINHDFTYQKLEDCIRGYKSNYQQWKDIEEEFGTSPNNFYLERTY